MLGHFSRHANALMRRAKTRNETAVQPVTLGETEEVSHLRADECGSFRLSIFVHVDITFRDLSGAINVIAAFIQNVRLVFLNDAIFFEWNFGCVMALRIAARGATSLNSILPLRRATPSSFHNAFRSTGAGVAFILL